MEEWRKLWVVERGLGEVCRVGVLENCLRMCTGCMWNFRKLGYWFWNLENIYFCMSGVWIKNHQILVKLTFMAPVCLADDGTLNSLYFTINQITFDYSETAEY